MSPSGSFAAVNVGGGRVEVMRAGHPVWESTASTGLSSVLDLMPGGSLTLKSSRMRTAPASAATSVVVDNEGDLAILNHGGVPIWRAGLHAHVTSSSISPYTRGAFFGPTNPSVTCFTCIASDITGSAPPSNTLDAGTGVDAMTGDFSTQNSLFDSPAIGGDLAVSLSYDAQLAQSQLTGGYHATAGTFGPGWSAPFMASINQQSGSSPTSTITVNQGNGSEVSFNESLDYGTSTSCQPVNAATTGDYPTTNKYTQASSNHQWCALASVRGQLADADGTSVTYQSNGGSSVEDFAWNGQLTQETSAAAQQGSSPAGLTVLYGVSGGSVTKTAAGVTLPRQCPSGVTCTIVYSSDARDLVEEYTTGPVTKIIDPSGATYTLAYDSTYHNLTSVTVPNGLTTSTWHYVYATTAGSPYTGDLLKIEDPDYNASISTTAHATAVAYFPSSTPGMVSTLTDGTGAVTSYTFTTACAPNANPGCSGSGQSQTTTITYPAEQLCPTSVSGCTSASPREIDQYSAGLETSTQLGQSTNAIENETWSYAWNYGNGVANSSEVITYPDTINVAKSASFVAPSATIITDLAGDIVSTTNANGDVATSAYNDVGANVLNELVWSFPGPSSNAQTSPPTGSYTYTYNAVGEVLTATDPLGNITSYGYYANNSLACFSVPPSVNGSLSAPAPTSCTSTSGTADQGAVGAPTGSTTDSYDAQGDLVAQTVDANDTSGNADSQTTTASYDAMGNVLWSIPPTGQAGVQSSANPFATSTTYSSADLPTSVVNPGLGATTLTYDAAFNVVAMATPAATMSYVRDGDNRVCYQLVASTAPSGLTCTSAAQSGSSTTTYVPGSTTVATTTDSLGHVTSYYYGDLAYPNSPTEVVDPAGNAIQFSASDDYGNTCDNGDVAPVGAEPAQGTSAQCNALAGDTSTVFDPLGNATSVTDPSGNVTANAFSNASFPTQVTSMTNPLGATTTYAYDAAGNLLTTTNPDGTAVSLAYDANGNVCSKESTALHYACGQGPSVAGVSLFTYNDAGERTSMSDNVGNPNTPTQWSQVTAYTYTNGQLTSTTDANGKTLSYLYNYAGQVQCVTYPVSASATCGTLSSPATGSTTNTIVTRSYDSSGRLASVSDWLGNSTSYTYGDVWTPTTPTKITYPTSTGVTATYGYDANGNVTSLSAGSSITDVWHYDTDQRESSATINGVSSGTTSYNANNQTTQATNLASSTSNDTYTIAPNGAITQDAAPSGATQSFAINAGGELCWSASLPATPTCSSPPTGAASLTNFTYTTNGQRASAATITSSGTTITTYNWNPLGQLCDVSAVATACAVAPSTGQSYSYNGDGLRTQETATSSGATVSTTDSTWDSVSGGSIPLNVNDAVTNSSSTTNTSYLYGALLFGGTAPLEQVTTTSSGSTASFLVPTQSGVQGVYSSSGVVQEIAVYSTYGVPTYTTGSQVTLFGFQGSYTDATGLIYLINRYYDPTTDQFLSVDPLVIQTVQPYVFTNDNPLNESDSLGLVWFDEGFMMDMGGGASNYGTEIPGLGGVEGEGVEGGGSAGPEGEATVGDANLPETGKIKGYTEHGHKQVMTRDGGRGVNDKALEKAVEHPEKVVKQSGGTTKYVGQNATVVLNEDGQVVSAWANNSSGWRYKR